MICRSGCSRARRVATAVAMVGVLQWTPGGTATRYVDIKTCPSVGAGTLASPYCEIQTAIDGALPGDLVKVAAGVYTTKHTRSIAGDVPIFPNPATAVVFMRDQVHLEGAGAGISILDAGGADRVVIFDRVEAGTRFQGFTVTGGDTTGRVGDGAGLLLLLSSPLIQQNRIAGNHAFYGGGVSVVFGAPQIQDNVIEHNTAGNDIQSATGGGIDVAFESNPLITRNIIIGNYAHGSGGGLAFYETNGQADSNRIEGNVAELNGGGVYSAPIANTIRGKVTLRSNTISLNVARAGDGGGIFAAEGTDLLMSTLSRNRAVLGDGGGAFTWGSAGIILRDNLIDRNGAAQGGGIYFDPTSHPTVAGNDVVGNLPFDFGGGQDPTGSQGNFSLDPLLVNAPDFVIDVQIDRWNSLVAPVDPELSRQFAVGDFVEYGDDGVRRLVTQILTAVGVPLIKLETSPILTEAETYPYPVVLRRWGANGRLDEDFGTRNLSPLIDVAGSTSGPPTDAMGHARLFDGNLDGQSRHDVGATENLAELPQLGIIAGGTLSWTTFPDRIWHYHLYRGLASDLADGNKDGIPDGADRVAGTADDGFGSCLVPGVSLPGPDYLDLDVPPPGKAFYYLGTLTDLNEGILGFDSAGRVRANLHSCN